MSNGIAKPLGVRLGEFVIFGRCKVVRVQVRIAGDGDVGAPKVERLEHERERRIIGVARLDDALDDPRRGVVDVALRDELPDVEPAASPGRVAARAVAGRVRFEERGAVARHEPHAHEALIAPNIQELPPASATPHAALQRLRFVPRRGRVPERHPL